MRGRGLLRLRALTLLLVAAAALVWRGGEGVRGLRVRGQCVLRPRVLRDLLRLREMGTGAEWTVKVVRGLLCCSVADSQEPWVAASRT